MSLPGGALNSRESAHFKDISEQYTKMMFMELNKKALEIKSELKNLPREERLMKYAHPTYKYVPLKNVG